MSIEIKEILAGNVFLLAFFVYTLWLQFIAWKKPQKVKYLHIFEFDDQMRKKAVIVTKVFGPILSLITLILLVGNFIKLINGP